MPLCDIFFSEAFEGADMVMKIVAPTLITSGLSLYVIYVSLNRMKIFLNCVAIGALVSLVLNILLMPRYGATGAAISLLATEMVVHILLLYYLRSIYSLKWLLHYLLKIIAICTFIYILLVIVLGDILSLLEMCLAILSYGILYGLCFCFIKENVVISSMSFIVIIILLLLACASYGIFKTISHPAFITSFLWFCILLIYQTVDHGLYDLSDKFYGVLLLWNIGFYFSSLAICYVRFPIFVNWHYDKYNSGMKVLLPIFIISLIIAIYGLYIKGNYYNSDNIFRGIRESSVLAMEGEDDFQYPIYVTSAMAVVGQSVAVLISLLYVGKKKNLFVVIYACLVLLFFV